MKPKYTVRTFFGETVLVTERDDIKVGDRIIPKGWSKDLVEQCYGNEIPTVKFIKGNPKEYHLHEENTSGGYIVEGTLLKVCKI